MSYKPGFWEASAKPFAKTACFLALAGGLMAGAGVGIKAGCSYSNRADAEAEKIAVDTNRDAPCTSSLVTRKGAESLDAKCKHKEHVLRTKWERGELTIQCLCPNTIEDEKTRPKEVDGSTSEGFEDPKDAGE